MKNPEELRYTPDGWGWGNQEPGGQGRGEMGGDGEERSTDRRVELRTEPLRWAWSSTLGRATHHSLISSTAAAFPSVCVHGGGLALCLSSTMN